MRPEAARLFGDLSVLPQVFADFIREGRLREQDLRGLGDDKLEYVRLYATT